MIGVITGSFGIDTDFGQSCVVVNRHLGADGSRVPPHKIDYLSLVQDLKDKGVTSIVAFHTVGGISEFAIPGSMFLSQDVVDYTYGRYNSDEGDHLDMTETFDHGMVVTLWKYLSNSEFIVNRGTMAVTQGPRLETPAEVQRLKADGCQVVGMTAMPEAYYAKLLNIPYVSVGLVVNKAAGLGCPSQLTSGSMQLMQKGFSKVATELVYELIREKGAVNVAS